MKTQQIYVGINGAHLAFQSGKGIVVYPPQKGVNFSMVLSDSGKLIKMNGSRINGVGVARYLKENGFELAQPGDLQAEKLADLLDVRDGLKFVENACSEKAIELQSKFAGQTCTYVPFAADRPIEQIEVKADRTRGSLVADLADGMSSYGVAIEYKPGSNMLDTLVLTGGWIVGPGKDASQLPRGTEYGGPVEQTVFILCNAGLGKLVGPQNLEMDPDAPADARFAKGFLEIALTNGDQLFVGIDAGDELLVDYMRDSKLLYSRSGIHHPSLGSVIASIGAVLVRVAELDAVTVKKAIKRAA